MNDIVSYFVYIILINNHRFDKNKKKLKISNITNYLFIKYQWIAIYYFFKN